MKKRLLAAAISSWLLIACGSQNDGQNVEIAAAKQTGPKAELGEWGITLADIDQTTKAGDDFYQYVNGKWVDSFQIPDEFSSYGSFTVLVERSETRVREIIENAANDPNKTPGSNAQKVGDFFASYLDVEAINAAGLTPIAQDLARIDEASTHDDIARLMADPALGASAIIGAWVDVDSGNPSEYILYITQDGLGLPNKTYYTDLKFADKKALYNDYIAQILTLAGIGDRTVIDAEAQSILALEDEIAQAHWAPAKRRNRDLTYNKKTLAELERFAPGAPWALMFEAAGISDLDTLIVREDDALKKLAKIFGNTPVETWQAYLRFHLLSNNASILPSAFDEAHFSFYGTELRGTPKQKIRWKRAVGAVNGALGEAVGAIYVDQYFPQSSKDQMQELVANLRKTLDLRLDDLAWMSDATKIEAHAKLEKFTTKIGYPEKWQDYAALTIKAGDAYGNAKRARAFAWQDMISKLGGEIDRTQWFMTPQTVNAYYSPNRNEIVFPAAILQAPFFDPHADAAVNYGGIGAVIGHEIGHGFDDQGRKSDGDGLLRDWWSDEDAANFQKLADRLGAQYGEYEPVPGFKLRPDLTMGENIGDLGGVSMAYHAYKLSLNGEEAPIIDGLTGDQRFFMAWAQVWKRVVREERLKNQIETGPHSPAKYRVNGVVRNMDAWYKAFDVKEGDAMYLPPEARVEIW